MKTSGVFFLSLFSCVSLGMVSPAFAYLDPGTGSMLLQLLLGGVAGFLVIGKLYWHRFKSIFVKEQAPVSLDHAEKK